MAFVVQGSRSGRSLLLALIALALCAIWGPGSSRASMILGSDLATAPTGNTQCSFMDSDRGCLAIDDTIPGGTAVSPSTGFLPLGTSAWARVPPRRRFASEWSGPTRTGRSR